MIAIILLLLFIAPAWTLAQESEQISLAEAARRERARRATFTEKVPILTNRHVEEMGGLVSIATAPPPPLVEGEGEEDKKPWEERFNEAKLDLQTAENGTQVLLLQLEYLRDQWLSSDNGVTQQRIRQQLEETQEALEGSRQAVEDAQAAYEALQAEAKDAGLMPGELRDLMDADPGDSGDDS